MTTDPPKLSDLTPAGDQLPQPTYAPAAMAMACAMLTWGLLTHWSLSLAGGGLLAWGLWRWLSDIALEWGHSQ